jgi:hypothetical protein
MVKLKKILRKIPVIYPLYLFGRKICVKNRLKNQSVEDVFVDMYYSRSEKWTDRESVSGSGSTSSQTKNIVQKLPELFKELGAISVLDIPRGDFF